jgi:hypothetical protein
MMTTLLKTEGVSTSAWTVTADTSQKHHGNKIINHGLTRCKSRRSINNKRDASNSRHFRNITDKQYGQHGVMNRRDAA